MGFFDSIFKKEEEEQLPAYRYDFQAPAGDPTATVVQDAPTTVTDTSVNVASVTDAPAAPSASQKSLAEIYGQAAPAQEAAPVQQADVATQASAVAPGMTVVPSMDAAMPAASTDPTAAPQVPGTPEVDLAAPVVPVAPVVPEMPVASITPAQEAPTMDPTASEVPVVEETSAPVSGEVTPEATPPADPVAAMGTDTTATQPAYMWDVATPVAPVAPTGSIEETAVVAPSVEADALEEVITKLDDAVAALKKWHEAQKAATASPVVKQATPQMADAYMENKLDQINQQLGTPTATTDSTTPTTTA